MGVFFGTDGLRGVVNEELTYEVAYKCGNALTTLTDAPLILIGRDTRVSGEYLTVALACGAMSGGGRVVDLGVIPTSGVAYLTRTLGADYGVVISASHNPPEYNGIKIFDKNGYKLSEREEERVERSFIRGRINSFSSIGGYRQDFRLIRQYEDFLISTCEGTLDGMHIVIDGACGAASRVVPAVFRRLGASVSATSCSGDGMRINDGCGALCPEALARRMRRSQADIGFAFDGDADRLIAVDDGGRIVDGDMIIYMLALYMKERGLLRKNTVVGTSHTNMGIERALAEHGIGLVRTDVGDRYVLERLAGDGLSLGGEQSGHIILKDIHSTGDGILTAIAVASMVHRRGRPLSELFDAELYPQTNINVVVSDKMSIMNSALLSDTLGRIQSRLSGTGRVMVRASGTEPKIRIMVESPSEEINRAYSEELASAVREQEGS